MWRYLILFLNILINFISFLLFILKVLFKEKIFGLFFEYKFILDILIDFVNIEVFWLLGLIGGIILIFFLDLIENFIFLIGNFLYFFLSLCVNLYLYIGYKFFLIFILSIFLNFGFKCFGIRWSGCLCIGYFFNL